jgi:hypothetical protein
MILRDLGEKDLMQSLNLDPSRIGAELVGREAAINAWKKLIRSRSFNAVVVEHVSSSGCHEIIGCGSTAFVSQAFADSEISTPSPGLNARIIASIHQGRSVVLNDSELRSANTHGGLDLVILYSSLSQTLVPDTVSDIHSLMGYRFLELHSGYRINRLMTEIIDEEHRKYYLATNVWRVTSNFEEFYSQHPESLWGPNRALALVTHEEAFSVPGNIAAMVFHYTEPVLQLREAGQRLLLAAVSGCTDEELATKLNLSVAAVKKRWASLFDRVSEMRPDLFPDDHDDSQKRGQQKRHRILAYVRAHPEELRPFETQPHPPRDQTR